MKNFSTNQARHFYVAGAIDANLDTKLDIALGSVETGEMFFKYKDPDGLILRSDSFLPSRITELNKKGPSDVAGKLMAHTISVDTNIVALSSLVGKTVSCKVSFKGVYDDSSMPQMSFTAYVVGTASNTASASAFNKDLAMAIAKALPKPDKSFPLLKVFSNGSEVTADTPASGVTGASTVVLVETVQKYVRGKLSGDPVHFDVIMTTTIDGVDVSILSETVAASAISGNTVVPANYKLADMEFFCMGERGDVMRGYAYPNDFNPTYAIDPFSNTQYYILTLNYFWAGTGTDVQKSPRVMHVVGPQAVINSLYNSIKAAIDGTGSGSGSGSGA